MTDEAGTDAERTDDDGSDAAEADEAEAAATLRRPSPVEARELVADGLTDGRVVTLVGRCSVGYEGRATGSLDPGVRHCTFKPDGTALVHADEGQQPVTWLAPSGDHAVAVRDDRLVVESRRGTAADRLVVRFESVAHAASFGLTGDDRAVEGSEADLRRRVLATPSLVEPGFRPLSTERRTAAGAVDVFGEDAEGRTVVVELKRRRVGPDAVGQLQRYVAAVERDLHDDAAVRGILVAPSITDRARELLAERDLEFARVKPRADDGETGS